MNEGYLEAQLNKHFHYQTFHPGQKEIIYDVLAGKDVLGILPTGSGKSLCYQLPALLIDGLVVVVSPLISLMMDQVKELIAIHYKGAVAINSFVNWQERKEIYANLRRYRLIYISPELLQQKELLQALKQIEIRLFVIDEAHCISQWGHEFRPDYLKLGQVIAYFNNPTVLALSATATADVQTDIMHALGKTEMVKHIHPIDKANLILLVEKVADEFEKIAIIKRWLEKYHVPVLIYFSSRYMAENVARTLSHQLPDKRIAFYHGGLEQMDRIYIQQQFMNDQLDVICCTSAFGMGINKKNIRLVIHYHLPVQIESYIQEIGRAGRDGKACISLLLYGENDAHIPRNLIQNELPTEQNLTHAFQYIHHLYQEGKAFPDDEQLQASMLQINENQWRFLHHQFEKHGIINNKQIIYHQGNWQIAYKQIADFVKVRLRYKVDKLTEMLNWISEKSCLRAHLYKSFQPTYQKKQVNCCSNCGFTERDWEPEELPIEVGMQTTWESSLRELLLMDIE